MVPGGPSKCEGDDLGKWLQRQQNPGTWAQLSTEQQQRLSKLGVQPDQAPSPAPAAERATKKARARRSRRSSGAWQPSRSGSSGKAPTGPCRGVTANRSRSTARRSC
ncbi:helicase associated domain-containing protein [Streptomyces sp. NPDC051822]|uniref:helicase associated domain-containing protein n=1 Tax=Streptomyces sp. NPDC051822 TaxID=3365675 RepID=UPI0037B333A3